MGSKIKLEVETSILKEVCTTVGTDYATRVLLQSKLKRMYNSLSKCTGLAAPQIGITLRAILINTRKYGIEVQFNPKVIAKSIIRRRAPERCMSFKKRYKMWRPIWLIYKWEDIDGRIHRRWCPYKIARLVDHEVDHLDGKCIDRGGLVKE